MHSGFALELPNVDLSNIDLLDTHLDLLDTDIPSKYFACLHNIFKTSSRHIFKTSSRHVFRHVFKTSSRHVFKTSSRRLQRNNFSSSKTNKCLLGSLASLITSWSYIFMETYAKHSVHQHTIILTSVQYYLKILICKLVTMTFRILFCRS